MSTETPLSLRDIELAAEQVHGRVRRTPVMHAVPLKESIAGVNLFIKLENLQISGSFKARGAINKLAHLSRDEIARGLVTASGGNHGLAVAYAGWLFNVPATVYLPSNAPMIKETNLKAWGATVKRVGQVWDEANVAALEEANKSGATYIHPFNDPIVIAGQGTLALEILHDLQQVNVIVIAIGGGGLIAGAALAAKSIKPSIKVIGVEPTGAPTLYESVKAGCLITLDHIATQANTLAPRRSSQLNLDLISKHVDEMVLVTDDEMRSTAQWLWRELGIGAELSSAAAVAALLHGKVTLPAHANVCAVVCSAGTDGMG